MISKITYWLKNKYAYTLLFFIIWVCFIDQNNIMTAYTYNVELKKLETEKTYFNEAIEKTSKELFDLTENPATLEKFARENYFMKKKGEEVFVFTTE